jgi:hypothetical protein
MPPKIMDSIPRGIHLIDLLLSHIHFLFPSSGAFSPSDRFALGSTITSSSKNWLRVVLSRPRRIPHLVLAPQSSFHGGGVSDSGASSEQSPSTEGATIRS